MTKMYQSLFLIVLLFTTNLAYANTSCEVDYSVRSDWGNGFTIDVAITNKADAWTGWDVTWTMPDNQQITGLWNGQKTQAGVNVSVKSYTWNANITTGKSIKFGFNGSYSGVLSIPNDVRVNGTLCLGQASITDSNNGNTTDNSSSDNSADSGKSCKVTYEISSQWNTGFTSTITVENTGIALSGWTVAWDMPNQQKVTQLWNASYQQQAQAVSVTNLNWNANIANAGKINFGFNASHEGDNQIPANISLDGVLCDGQTPVTPIDNIVSCEANYTIRDQWNTGFTSDVVIKNTGSSALNDWEVSWTMPSGQVVTNSWNGQFSQNSSSVTVNPADWNKTIPSNENLEFGFNASYSGENPIPIDISVNGIRCAGQSDEIRVRPNAPSHLKISLRENSIAVLSWTDNSNNEDNFRIERRKLNQNWQSLSEPNANVNNYEDTTLIAGQSYEYRLLAANSTGLSSYTNTALATRQDHSQLGGNTLVENCYICHATEGISQGAAIPTIAGLDKDYLVRTMQSYKDESRPATIMGRLAKGYSAAEIEEIATILATKTYTPVQQTTDPILVSLGRKIHDENCSVCHTDNGHAKTTGSPIAGQWKPYLTATLDDFIAGNNAHLPQAMINQINALTTQYGDTAVAAIVDFYAANPNDQTGYDSTDSGNTGSGTDSGNTGGGTDSGNTGGGSNNAVLTAPTSLTATSVDNEKVVLTWLDQSSSETGFKVERSIDNTTWQEVASLAADSLQYEDTTVSIDRRYYYRVAAYDAQATEYSNAVTADLLAHLAYGKKMYENQGCASCHGDNGQGGFTNVPLIRYTATDLSNLTQVNATTMPRTAPENCVGNCAAATASYIIEVLSAASGGTTVGNNSCTDITPASHRSLRLLTRYEYQNTVNDLLGLSVDLIHELPDENRVAGFDNNIDANQVTALRLEAFLNKAESLANQAAQQNFNGILPCSTEGNSCAQRFIAEFGQRAYRRPLSSDEQSRYLAYFSQDSFSASVEKTVMSMLMSPNLLYRSELGILQTDGSYQLTDYEIASQLSYLFWGSMPDAELMQLADNNALNSDSERIAQAYRLFNHPRSREALGNFAGQWLLGSSPYSLAEKDQATYPAYSISVREALSQELIQFFNHVTFDSSQKYRELFSSNYILANKTLADYYGFTGPIGNTFEVTPVNNGTRTGVLTLGAVLAKYATSNSSHPFKRGAFFIERLLCHDLPEPANMGIIEAPVPDANATTRELFSFHSQSDTSCYSCHQYLDGPGFSFENYDGAGQFRATENTKTIDPSGILRGLETYTADEERAFSTLSELSQIVAESPNASQCIARQYYRYTMGREETAADHCALDSYLKNYQVSDYNLQTMLLGIVNSPNFTKRQAQ